MNVQSEAMSKKRAENSPWLIPNPGAKYRDYLTKASRIRSFREWPVGLRQKPNDLAEAGFIYTGKGDQVCCFYCGLGLKNWAPEDDPIVEHARWLSDQCSFLMLKAGSEFITLVRENKDSEAKRLIRQQYQESN